MNIKYPETLLSLIAILRKLPGIGFRTAERFAFELTKWKPDALQDFSKILEELPIKIIPCQTCGCFTQEGICQFCNPHLRDPHSLCILSSPRDVYAIESTQAFRGQYHVIEHLLSPLDGRLATTIRIDRIEKRIQENNIKEIILAFDSTLEGDATALYLKEKISSPSVSFTRLAFGIPIGSSLEYVDQSTLAKALHGRQHL